MKTIRLFLLIFQQFYWSVNFCDDNSDIEIIKNNHKAPYITVECVCYIMVDTKSMALMGLVGNTVSTFQKCKKFTWSITLLYFMDF